MNEFLRQNRNFSSDEEGKVHRFNLNTDQGKQKFRDFIYDLNPDADTTKRIDLSNIHIEGGMIPNDVSISRSIFTNSQLRFLTFESFLDCSDIDFTGTTFESVKFECNSLRRTKFTNSTLIKVDFLNDKTEKKSCDLTHANFRNAILKEVDFSEVQTLTADQFGGADLTNSKLPDPKLFDA